jgi:hypothetical protein
LASQFILIAGVEAALGLDERVFILNELLILISRIAGAVLSESTQAPLAARPA